MIRLKNTPEVFLNLTVFFLWLIVVPDHQSQDILHLRPMPRLLLAHDPHSLPQELRSLVDLVLQTAGLQNLSQAAGGIGESGWAEASLAWLEAP